MCLLNATLIMYASYTDQLGSPSGSATAYRAISHAAEIVPRDDGAGRRATKCFLECHPVLSAHHVVQDRVRGCTEVI